MGACLDEVEMEKLYDVINFTDKNIQVKDEELPRSKNGVYYGTIVRCELKDLHPDLTVYYNLFGPGQDCPTCKAERALFWPESDFTTAMICKQCDEEAMELVNARPRWRYVR